MFVGEHQVNLDDKKRVSFPLRLRDCMAADELAQGFYITLGFEGSLALYPIAEWKKISARVSALPATQAEARKFQRLFLSNAQFLQLDKQKRFLIPEAQCKRVGITKEVVFVGVGRHVEVWPSTSYEAYMDSIKGEYEDLAEKVFAPAVEVGGEAAAALEE